MTIINDTVSLSSVGSVRTQAAERQPEPAKAPSAPSAGTDRVELSSGLQEVERLKQAADAEAPVRAEKVAALRKQIEEGTYQVDSRAVAARMVGLFR